MASYRRRLERDLDRWIADGLVAATQRDAILATAPDARRLDAATALGIVGALLAGVAVIAFVAANWTDIPRIARFAMILAAFLGVAAGAAWASGRDRPVVKNVLLSVAALIFGAAIGLTGQIFDLTGDPQAALRGAGLGAALLTLAGRSPWAAAVALIFIGLGDQSFGRAAEGWDWLPVAAPAGLALAIFWRSPALAHVAGLALLACVPSLLPHNGREASFALLSAGLVFAGLAAGGRRMRERHHDVGPILYGWFAAGALVYFGASGFAGSMKGVGHSVIWLAASGGVIALGRHDGHGLVTAAGVVSILAAGAALLFNLGVGLLTAAGVFGACALGALAIAAILRGRRKA